MSFASAGDDGKIYLWNYQTGQCFGFLSGHTKPVITLAMLDDPGSADRLLASGSADKTIRIWDLEKGSCVSCMALHRGAVKCILCDAPGHYVSLAVSDPNIACWSARGGALEYIPRCEDETVNAALVLAGRRLVVATESILLGVYDLATACDGSAGAKSYYRQLYTAHREAVTILTHIDDRHFASASMDGTVVVWDGVSLHPLHTLNAFPVMRDHGSRIFLHAVRCLEVLNDRRLLVATGKGFALYDAITGEELASHRAAHTLEVTALVPLLGGICVALVSEDAALSIWSLPSAAFSEQPGPRPARTRPTRQPFSPAPARHNSPRTTPQRGVGPTDTPPPLPPQKYATIGGPRSRRSTLAAQIHAVAMSPHGGTVKPPASTPGTPRSWPSLNTIVDSGKRRGRARERDLGPEFVVPKGTRRLLKQTVHTAPVLAAIAFADGLATAGEDGRIVLWKADLGLDEGDLDCSIGLCGNCSGKLPPNPPAPLPPSYSAKDDTDSIPEIAVQESPIEDEDAPTPERIASSSEAPSTHVRGCAVPCTPVKTRATTLDAWAALSPFAAHHK